MPDFIDHVINTIPGFTSRDFLSYLERLSSRRVLAIEIGAFKGRSTAVIANNIVGAVYSIDIWDTRMYHESMLLGDGVHWDECLAYRVFLQNMRRLNLAHKVIPMIGNSHWLERYFKPKSVDLIYIDGDHAEHMVLRDIQLYLPKLASGGVMCGDDYDMSSVRRPVDAMAKMSDFVVETFGDEKGWVYKKAHEK